MDHQTHQTQHEDLLRQAKALMDSPSLPCDFDVARRLAMLEFRERMSARWLQDEPTHPTSSSLPPRQPARRGSVVRSQSSGSALQHRDRRVSEVREWAAHECPSSRLRMPMRSLDETEHKPSPVRMPAAA